MTGVDSAEGTEGSRQAPARPEEEPDVSADLDGRWRMTSRWIEEIAILRLGRDLNGMHDPGDMERVGIPRAAAERMYFLKAAIRTKELRAIMVKAMETELEKMFDSYPFPPKEHKRGLIKEVLDTQVDPPDTTRRHKWDR